MVQASVIGSASAVGSPVAAQNRAALKEGSSASTCSATAFASSMRPSLASAAASTLRDTLDGLHTATCGMGRFVVAAAQKMRNGERMVG